MSAFFTYFLQINMALAVLVIAYYVLLRKVKLLLLNRCILLLILVVSAGLPFCPAITYKSGITHVQEDRLSPGNKDNRSGAILFPSTVKNATEGNVKNIYRGLLIVYGFISLVLIVKLIVQVASIKRIIRNSDQIKEEGLVYCRTEKYAAPFSFFTYIVLPKELDAAYPQVLVHEQAHARQWHSVDALLSELVCALLWINPIVYLYRKLVKANLEFLADEAVLSTGADAPAYQLSLLQYALKASGNTVMSSFYSSTIKSRIRMMNAERPYARGKISYCLIVPVLVAVYLCIIPPRAIPREVAMRQSLSNRLPGNNMGNDKGKDTKAASVLRKESKLKGIPKQSNVFAKERLKPTIVENTSTVSTLYIDARTDTVRINLRPAEQPIMQPFTGLYLIGDKTYSEPELRKAVEQAGQLVIILPAKPRIAYYSPGSADAIQRWGSQAEKGIVQVEPITIAGL
ncbi:M56 family metallopeptidase [Paraflavitalea soli]|nr:M56 family metallopeptidase [Paraflavitalea soli]